MMMGGWMVIFWALIIAVPIWLVREGYQRQQGQAPDALGILERRFAEGSISFDEYRERQ